jgi:hypothetical protein
MDHLFLEIKYKFSVWNFIRICSRKGSSVELCGLYNFLSIEEIESKDINWTELAKF